jgi:hypothetical protein
MIISNSTEPSLSKLTHGDHHDENLTRQEILHIISKKRWDMRTGAIMEFPPLNSSDDLPEWIARVEEDIGDVIPRSQWPDAAILYLVGYEARSMRRQRARRIEAGALDIWIWEDFQKSLSQVLGKVPIHAIQRLDLGYAY